ncbi:MAG TPA: phosphoesterase [Terriglobia bacterium]|nr:phosphoesterase [Terriglobia bacterium]
MKVRVCFHNRCFDGACSAAVFSRFYREIVDPHAEFLYHGLLHRAGQLFDEDMFDGDENVIVDFKYCSSPRLTWWFDHHQSAFLTPEDAEHFRQDRSGRKFYDPAFRSCTKFIAHIAATKFGFCAAELDEVIHWADIIDGAQYPDSKTAVEMRDPATQITMVIEGAASNDFVAGLIPDLLSRPLQEIAALPHIRQAFERLYDQHLKTIDIIRNRALLRNGVVFLDLSDQNFEGFNKFIPYYLFPESVYNVALSGSRERIKIAVGSNPWNPTPKDANLASICERYGGGGHAKVAAISLPPNDLARGKEIAREIVQELRSSLQ